MFIDHNTKNVYSIYEINNKSSNRSRQITFRVERIEIPCICIAWDAIPILWAVHCHLNGQDRDKKSKIKMWLLGFFFGGEGGSATKNGGVTTSEPLFGGGKTHRATPIFFFL